MKPPVGSRGGWCGAVPTQGTWSAADRGQAAQQFDNMFHLIYVRLYRDGVLFDSTTVQDQTVWADHRGGRASGTLNCDGTHGIPLPGTFSLQGV